MDVDTKLNKVLETSANQPRDYLSVTQPQGGHYSGNLAGKFDRIVYGK